MPNLVKQRRLLLASAIVVPALVFAAAAAWNRAEVLHDSADAVTRTTAVMHEHAAKVFDTADLILAYVDDRTRTMTWQEIAKPETSAFLARTISSLQQVVSVWITDANGVVQAGSQPWDKDVRISERPFFQIHQNSPAAGTQISSWFVGRATNVASFAVSQRRSAADGAFDGITHVALSPDYFGKFYQEVVPPFTFAATLARSDGAVLAREPRLPDSQGMIYPPNNPLREVMIQGRKAGLLRTTSVATGRDIILAYRQIGSRAAYVGYAADVDIVLRRWRQNLRIYGLVAIVTSLTLVLISLFALRRMQAERAALRLAALESERRLAMEERLWQTQKMEALGQLASGVAHDFNNAAAVILAGLKLLEKRYGQLLDSGGDEVRRLIAGIREGAERGGSVTRRLLMFSRRDELRAEAIHLPALIEELRGILTISLPPGVALATSMRAGVPDVHADPGQLRTVLINLVINARDAMVGGGTVTVGAEADRVSPDHPHPSGLSAAVYVRLYVSDTGAGMDKETLERAVEPFFTTKALGQGTGLGLSMAHGFAEQSGGAMRLVSHVGHGTTVSIWLPVPPSSDTISAQKNEPAHCQ
jgi:signal transduction histidine kinase